MKNVEKPDLNVDETVKISFRGKKIEHRINMVLVNKFQNCVSINANIN